MKLKLMATAFMLCLSLTAIAQLKTIAESYEISMADVRLPTSETGTIAFKRCKECDFETRHVNKETVYEFDGERMSLEKFRRAIDGVERSRNIPVQVVHHLQRDEITKVFVVVH
jgi:hypothetical protein